VPSEEYWRLSFSGQSHTSLNKVEGIFKSDQRACFRLALARYAAVVSADSVYNVITFLSMIQNDYPDLDNILDPIQFISLKAQRGEGREYQLSTIRGFLRYWHKSQLWGVSDEFIAVTDNQVFKGNEKGRAVKTGCPIEGPYSPVEMQAIITGINNAFASGALSITPYLVTLIFAQRGIRRRQMVELVFGDFTQAKGKFWMNTPRGKQRGLEYREAFTKYEVSEDLYHAVQLQKAHVLNRLTTAQCDINGVADCLPVFPGFDALIHKPISSSKDITAGYHLARDAISAILKEVEGIIDVKSERTGGRLNLGATRFRRSLGSDMAREGYGVGPIATALDHTDLQNAGVYVETSAEIATRLNQRLGKMLAPMAQAFAGVIVTDERSAIRGNDPLSRVRSDDGEEGIGTCGEMGFCGTNGPVACYTCIKFQPWLEAPHEDVLIQLYEEREEMLAVTGDEIIAGVLDLQILAVEDVINRCAEMKHGAESGTNG
jgi:hypothetical protein